MISLFHLIQELENNLKPDCCSSTLIVNGGELKIKLYDTIADACGENEKYKWYYLDKIVLLNNKTKRGKGIVCHKCQNDKCVISLIIDQDENTRFCVAENIALK
ncbi:MAG: hypothetical protein FJZ67_03685 [Bacteroidetes bacterium]|nr:hypothetical protein [Bacteroidota bacterium]